MTSKFLALTAVVLLAGVAAFSIDASAAQYRGGGGGGHFGGGHFGGRGFGGRGFGGRGFGGAHFGGMRFGGNHFGGMRFGGARFGSGYHGFASRFGGNRFGYGGGRHFTGAFGNGGGFATRNAIANGQAGRFNGMAAGAGAGFANGRFGGRFANGFGGGGRFAGAGDFRRGQFGYGDFNPGYVGWAGPVFWPYAYDNMFDYAFWPYYAGPFGDAFWAYGYDDVFAGILTPEFVATPGPPAPLIASAPPPAGTLAPPPPPSPPVAFCGGGEAPGAVSTQRIAEAVHPDPGQTEKLNALSRAEAQARNGLAAQCSVPPPGTALARLDGVQSRLQAMVAAVDTVRAPLGDFYSSLSDEQKAEFNTMGQPGAPGQGAPPAMDLAQLCGPQNDIPVVSVPQVDAAIRPTPSQQTELLNLRNAADNADKLILASCPARAPLTPPGRLEAMRGRLEAIIQGVEMVRPALNNFYTALDAQQQARFDGLNQQTAAGG